MFNKIIIGIIKHLLCADTAIRTLPFILLIPPTTLWIRHSWMSYKYRNRDADGLGTLRRSQRFWVVQSGLEPKSLTPEGFLSIKIPTPPSPHLSPPTHIPGTTISDFFPPWVSLHLKEVFREAQSVTCAAQTLFPIFLWQTRLLQRHGEQASEEASSTFYPRTGN